MYSNTGQINQPILNPRELYNAGYCEKLQNKFAQSSNTVGPNLKDETSKYEMIQQGYKA